MRARTLLVACLAAAPAAAHADTFHATRSEALVERAHRVRVTVGRRHAALEVERDVWNGGERADQATFFLHPPPGGVAVRLRTRAIVDGAPRWFEGDLLEAEEAARRYHELTGLGGYYPKDPALLSWRSQDLLALQVFPCPPAQVKTVGYTLVAPSRYEDGRYVIALDAMGTEGLPAIATLRAEEGAGELFVDGERWAGGSLVLDREHQVSVGAPFREALAGALASVPFGPSRALGEWQVEARPRLSSVPEGARVVVVVDLSRSLRDGAREAAASAARAYLAHFEGKGARAAVVGFGRRARALTRGFVGLADAAAALDTSRFAPENGSELGLALSLADSLLTRVSPGPRRIVVVTDLLTRVGLEPEALRGVVRSGAVVHVATVEPGDDALERDDADPWAEVPRATGGVLFRASASTDAANEAARRGLFEEWARPRWIDRLRVTAPGLPEEEAVLDGSLAEGAGIERLFVADRGVPFVLVEGELWSAPVRRTFAPDDAHGSLWSALVLGSPLLGGLDEREMMTLARRGRAVSPVTSYLAIEPGVRPSTEGLDEAEARGVGFGTGIGSARFKGASMRGGGASTFDPSRWLCDALAGARARCGVAEDAPALELDVATTLDEVAGVSAAAGSGDDAKARDCVREEVWRLDLPPAFDEARAVYRITL
jgi:hypothetical protein